MVPEDSVVSVHHPEHLKYLRGIEVQRQELGEGTLLGEGGTC